MPLSELVDLEAERIRIGGEIEKAEANLARLEAKLSNEKFVSKAPEQIVAAEREKVERTCALIRNLQESLSQLEG